MSRIKHIAIRTGDVEKTAAFYRDAFGLKQVGLGQNGIYLTDGHLNIAILKFQPGENGEPLRLGIDHVGFQVDDVDATVGCRRTLGRHPTPSPVVRCWFHTLRLTGLRSSELGTAWNCG